MTTTSFERDMEEMVSSSDATPSQKSLARHFIRNCGPLANGSKGEITAISAAIVAQTPLLLEMYLQPCVTKAELDQALEDHTKNCVGIASTPMTAKQKWAKIGVTTLLNVRWPGAFLGGILALQEGINNFLTKLLP